MSSEREGVHPCACCDIHGLDPDDPRPCGAVIDGEPHPEFNSSEDWVFESELFVEWFYFDLKNRNHLLELLQGWEEMPCRSCGENLFITRPPSNVGLEITCECCRVSVEV